MRGFAKCTFIGVSGLAIWGACIAHAQGINLAWDECGSGGATNKDFACSTNAGTEDLVVSFAMRQLPAALDALGVTILIYAPDDSVVPNWWMLGDGLCREGSVSIVTGVGEGSCLLVPPPSGTQLYFSPRERLDNQAGLGAGVFFSPGWEITPYAEYLAARLVLRNSKTVGTDSCGGCSQKAVLTLEQVTFVTVMGIQGLYQPLRQNVVTWQAGIVPTRSKTWGQIKGMYR